MMLLNKSEQLIVEFKNLKALEESSTDSIRYNRRNEELKNINLYLEGLDSLVILFRNQGFKIDVHSILSYPAELFYKLKLNWENNTKEIIETNDFFTKIKLNNIENEVKNYLKTQWNSFVDSKKPNINIEQLNVLEKIPDLSQVVSDLKEKLEIIHELRQELPTQSDRFELVIRTTSEMKTLLEKLSSNDIPDAVIHFLKKAIEGINLSEITPEILAWLKENNLINHCQVKFK